MKKINKHPKNGNGKSTIVESLKPWKGIPDDSCLLLGIANRLSVQAKRIEDPEAWQEKCLEKAWVLLEEIEQRIKQKKSVGRLFLRIAQLRRDAGDLPPGVVLAFFVIPIMRLSDDERNVIQKEAFQKEPALQKKFDETIEAQLVIRNSSKLVLDWKDPSKTPEGYQALRKKSLGYYFAAVLRHLGEYDSADLLLNKTEIFNQRFKAGMLEYFKNDPEINLSDEFFEQLSF